MADLTIKVDLDNAEFDDDYKAALSRIMWRINEDILLGNTGNILFDVNGNRVGQWVIK